MKKYETIDYDKISVLVEDGGFFKSGSYLKQVDAGRIKSNDLFEAMQKHKRKCKKIDFEALKMPVKKITGRLYSQNYLKRVWDGVYTSKPVLDAIHSLLNKKQ